MKRSQPSDLKNLLNYYDYGGVGGTCNFLFLPLLGASLKELLETKTPTYCTSIQLSIQTLHIKPSNFVQGREDDTNTIYLIDFGMAVRFCTDPTKMPRLSAYSFIGTKVYASRATHKRKPQTRRDDMESWFFVALETFDRDILPWLKADISKIPSMKDTFFDYCPQAVFDKLPDCFESFARMIDLIGDFSTPNYEFFLNMLTTHAKKRDLDLEAPFEWLPKEPGISPLDRHPMTSLGDRKMRSRKSGTRIKYVPRRSKRSKELLDRETRKKERRATITIEEPLEDKPKESCFFALTQE
ncbi:Protein kinase domain-containing protein [Aphelenchoides besseyi]|nr:Protein kinase domain-containing protein [Aphelenchoides besseyi]